MESYNTICKIDSQWELCSMMQGAQLRCSVTTQRDGMGWEVRGMLKRENLP